MTVFCADAIYETLWRSGSEVWGIAVSGTGQIYSVNYGCYEGCITRYSANGNHETHWGSNGTGDGRFDSPQGIALSGTGQVYVVDRDNDRIQCFD